MNNDLDFKYKLYGPGWALAELRLGEINIKSEVSYLENTLGDLANGLRCCHEALCDDEEREHSFIVELHEEPSGYEMMFELVEADRLQIKVNRYSNLAMREGLLESYSEECSWKGFTKQLVTELENILGEHGIIGYKETWVEHDFPLVDFLWLKNYVLNSTAMELKILYGEDGNREVVSSNTSFEMSLLGFYSKVV